MSQSEMDTRQKIIEAAYTVLARDGYEKASTKEIAKEAGVAQGLINYYFNKKDDLYIEVFRKEKERYGAFLDSLAHVSQEQMMTHILSGLEDKVSTRSQWYRLRYDLFALGMRNAAFIDETKDFLSQGRANVEGVLTKIYPDMSREKLNSIASIIIVSLDGLALQKTVDPDFDIASAHKALFDMVDSAAKS